MELRDGNEPEKDNERHGSESHDLEKKWAESSVGALGGGFSRVTESVRHRDSEINIQQEIGIYMCKRFLTRLQPFRRQMFREIHLQ